MQGQFSLNSVVSQLFFVNDLVRGYRLKNLKRLPAAPVCCIGYNTVDLHTLFSAASCAFLFFCLQILPDQNTETYFHIISPYK